MSSSSTIVVRPAHAMLAVFDIGSQRVLISSLFGPREIARRLRYILGASNIGLGALSLAIADHTAGPTIGTYVKVLDAAHAINLGIELLRPL